MKIKYLFLTLALSFSIMYLNAQEQDTTQTKEQVEAETVVETDQEPRIQKKSDGIIITGPDGVVIDEPREKYQINAPKGKFRFEEEEEDLDSGVARGEEEASAVVTRAAPLPRLWMRGNRRRR